MKKDKEIFQCSCGHIHKVNEKYKPKDDEIYVTLWCPKCREYSRQLYCGDDINDLSMLCDINVDPRMY